MNKSSAAAVIQLPRSRSRTAEAEGTPLHLPWGLPGFENCLEFVLIEEPDSPIRWLQSTEEPLLAFPTVEPFLVCPDYEFEISDADVESLSLSSPADAAVLVILTIRSGSPGITANLMAPIIINRSEAIGRQLVLSESRYSTRYPVLTGGATTARRRKSVGNRS